MFKRIFFWGLTAGILSAVACFVYRWIFTYAYTYEGQPDFSKVVNVGIIVGINLIAGMLAALAFWAFTRWLPKQGELAFNILFTMVSFASIAYPIFRYKLPYNIQMPELFPILVIPMHFFPVIAWLMLRPAFTTGRLEIRN